MNIQIPEHIDPLLYIHHLYWELRRLKGSPNDFQKMFEDVSARAKDHFIRIRPYGPHGDFKCDGLYWDDGTAYQVYSPDELKELETRKKIEDDLSGAVKHWGKNLKKWVFVFNVQRGLPATVVALLQEQREKYPHVTIDPMSNDDLWKIVSKLSVQDRTEILGPPPGYEELFPLSATLPKEIQKRLESGRFVVIQDILSLINVQDAIKALKPSKPYAPPLFVRPPLRDDAWEVAAEYQKALIDNALAESAQKLPRFAVFSMSPIPLAINLGYILSDRVEVEPFQYDRDRKTWCWDKERKTYDCNFTAEGYPDQPIADPIDVVLRVSLSATISPDETEELRIETPFQLDLRVDAPDVMWLCHPDQLAQLSRQFRSMLRKIARLAPRCSRIHLFYAGPTGGAVVIGQAINPRMNPPVLLYQYNRQCEPRYSHVLTLS
jgi:SMODS-associated and fused to various effectors sensor domain